MLPQLKRLDRPMILAALTLAAIGTAAVYSANLSSDVPELRTTWQKQVFYAVVAVAAAAAVVRAPGRALYGASYPLYLTALLLLLAVLAWGTGETATRWLALGPVRFQPSEVAKIGTIAALARYLADLPPWQCDRPRVFAYAALVVVVPLLLVAKQPDLGTALALGAPLLPMIYWRGMMSILIFCEVCPLLGAVCSFEPL